MDQNNTFRKYSTYKDSGVVWLGEVPSHWDQRRVKFQLTYQKGKNPKDFVFEETDWVYLSMEYLRSNQAKIQYIKNTKGCILVNNDEILMLWDGSNAGEFIKSKKGILSSTMALITLSNSDQNYAWHYLKVIEIQLRESTIGMGIPHVSSDEFKNLLFLLPPPEEQTRIAYFLDQKTAQIDQAIAQKERLIKLLNERRQILIHDAVTRGLDPNVKMKDSGVEWIGEVPKHWRVKPLRTIGTCQNGISKSADYFGKGFPFVSYGDVYNNISLPDASGLAASTDSDRTFYSVKEGDVFFTRTSETVDEIGFASTCLKTIENATFSGFLIRFRPDSDLTKEFSKYYFSSRTHRAFFVKEMNLVIRASLSQELLKRLPVLLPPIEEQITIAHHLNNITIRIATAISLKIQEIEKLKEYKATLINSAVTGKIKV